MGMGSSPTWLRQVSPPPPVHMTTLTTDRLEREGQTEAKALGGSFKLFTPAPKPLREMTQLLRETQKDGDTQTN